jgi:hypothetical protein
MKKTAVVMTRRSERETRMKEKRWKIGIDKEETRNERRKEGSLSKREHTNTFSWSDRFTALFSLCISSKIEASRENSVDRRMELCNSDVTFEEWLLLSIGELVQHMGTCCLVSVRINSNRL